MKKSLTILTVFLFCLVPLAINLPTGFVQAQEPTPFLYQPFQGDWVSQMSGLFDHHFPNYKPDNPGQIRRIAFWQGTSFYATDGERYSDPMMRGYWSPLYEDYMWYDGHDGYDWKMESDSSIRAAADGVVTYADYLNDWRGNVVEIDHRNGYKTQYAHLSRVDVAIDQEVDAGDAIGLSGGGQDDPGRGNSTGPHLHFSAYHYLPERGWVVTDPFGWDAQFGSTDLLVFHNGEQSHNLWVSGSPRTVDGESQHPISSVPMNTQALGGSPYLLPPPASDSATFLSDVTLPDNTVVSPGQALVKTWRVQNSGTSTWDGYKLRFVGGDQMGAPTETSIPTTGPGGTVDITINLTAPTQPGDYNGYFQIVNAEGVWVEGGRLWVKIRVAQASSHISFFFDPPSPSNARNVHITAKAHDIGNLRAMRILIDGRVVSELGAPEVTADWFTPPYADGMHSIIAQAAGWDDPGWAHPEQAGVSYELLPGRGPANRAPNPPYLDSPGDHFVTHSIPGLCASSAGDPDGDPVTDFQFEMVEGPTSWISDWVTPPYNCATPPSLDPGYYIWHAHARDNHGNVSDWSNSRDFTLLEGVNVTTFDFSVPSPSAAEQIWIHTNGDVTTGETIVQVNEANDGTTNGNWHGINHFAGSLDVNSLWNTLDITDGPHVVRVTLNANNGSDVEEKTYTLLHRRPKCPYIIRPTHDSWVSSRTVNFQWETALRADNYHLVVSDEANPESDPTPLLDVVFYDETLNYVHTFDTDYENLYWSVRATNDVGIIGEGGNNHFGIDEDPPSSLVAPLSPVTTDTAFPVNWGGSDARSGLRWYDVQVRDGERGEWVDWMINTTDTAAIFTGQPGHTYYFRVRAMDEVGNWEAYPADDGDTYTLVDPTAAPSPAWWDLAYSYKRNLVILNNDSHGVGSHYPVRLHFDSTTTPTAGEIYNASQTAVKGNDVRVVYQDQTELDRLVQEFSATNIDIWFALQAGLGSGQSDSMNYQLYYGNAAAGTPPANVNNIFLPTADEHTVGLWHFQEGTGSTVYDTSGRGHNGSFSSAGWTADGRFGNAGVFNGSSSEVNFGNHSDFNLNQMTLEAWIYLTGSPGDYPHVFNKEAYWLRIMGSRQVEFSVATGAPDPKVTGNRQLELNTWYHIAATYDGNYARVYVSGVKEGERAIGGTVNNTSAPLKIGWTTNWPSAGHFPGRIHHVRVSKIARDGFPDTRLETDPEVQAGILILPPGSGTANLVVQKFNAYQADDTLGGGLIVQAVLRNEGDAPTTNGFYTDLYANHLPTGAGDYTGSIRYWIATPIEAGDTITLTTVIIDTASVASQTIMAQSGVVESNGTLYTQADSTGVVSEDNNEDNISSGLDVCVTSHDAYEHASASAYINGSFEDGSYAPDGNPTSWTRDAFLLPDVTMVWDNTQAVQGSKSVKIVADVPNDARWVQTVAVQPDTDYRLSGWIKTENVAHTSETVDAGANLSLYGTWDRTSGLFGTSDWTYVTLDFNSGSNTQVTIAARLGYWGGTTTGTAWFDDLRLEPLSPSELSDDSSAGAQFIAIGNVQTHNFDSTGDQDWVKFVASGGITYTIQTGNLGPSADTYLYLYDTGATTLLAANDDYGGTLASQIEWTAPITNTYYVMVKHWNPNMGGCGTSYNLSIGEAGAGQNIYLPIIQREWP
jgi:murein DD-endopeptidase MepM/ murein hydrolase activator NlpD